MCDWRAATLRAPRQSCDQPVAVGLGLPERRTESHHIRYSAAAPLSASPTVQFACDCGMYMVGAAHIGPARSVDC